MKYTEKDFTQWHYGYTKPVHKGVYHVRGWDGRPNYSRWNGRNWIGFSREKRETTRSKWFCANQNRAWRGLRIKPKG